MRCCGVRRSLGLTMWLPALCPDFPGGIRPVAAAEGQDNKRSELCAVFHEPIPACTHLAAGGRYEKEQIRALAREAGLPVAQKPDSQEICFVPDKDYAGFIARYTGGNPAARGVCGRAGPGAGPAPGDYPLHHWAAQGVGHRVLASRGTSRKSARRKTGWCWGRKARSTAAAW